MAWRFDATTERLSRTTSPPSRTAFTLCGWAQRASHAGAYATIAGIGQASTNPSDAYELAWGSDGLLELNTYASGAANDFTTNYGDGEWFFFAMVGGASSITAYAAAPGDATLQSVTGTTVTFTSAALWFGNNGWGEGANFRLAGIKVWDAALTQTELQGERYQLTPVRRTNVHLFAPGFRHTELTDMSGAGRTLTATGTLSTEEGPPVPWKRARSRRAQYASAAVGGGVTEAGLLVPTNMRAFMGRLAGGFQ